MYVGLNLVPVAKQEALWVPVQNPQGLFHDLS